MSDTQRNDEIDLLELFQKIFSWFGKVFTWIGETALRVFLFYVRKSPYLFGFLILGVVVGYGIWKITPRYYSSEMIIKPNSISNADLVHFINGISMKGDNNKIAANFNIDTTQVANIKSIKASWFIDVNKDGTGDYVDYDDAFNISDTSMRRINNRLNIKVEIYDTSAIHGLSEGIIHYIESIQFFKKSHNVKIRQIKEDLAKVELELSELDSLQGILYFEEKLKTNENDKFLILNEKEEQLLHPQIISLYNQKLEYERNLELYPDMITVIQDFTPVTQAENNIFKLMINWAAILFGIGFILLGVIRQLQFLRDIIKKY